jgi:Cof subfamily protein (haloacid dehalogenase superfamily)
MLALNIDGTLLKQNKRLTKATKEAVQFVKNKGVYVTLVTSRNYPSAQKVAKALKINSLLVTHSGAFIGDSVDDPLLVKRISEEQTISIVRKLEHYECNIRILHERYSLGNNVKQKSNMVAKGVLGAGDPVFYPLQFVESLSDTVTEHPVAPPKIDLFFSKESEMQKAITALQQMMPSLNITPVNKYMVEILPEGVSKARGMQILGEKLGISLSEMVVIGDSLTDKDMIAQSGLGVAMGNAPAEVKRVAKWITRSNELNGVSYMIKEHFRKQHHPKFLKDHTKA